MTNPTPTRLDRRDRATPRAARTAAICSLTAALALAGCYSGVGGRGAAGNDGDAGSAGDDGDSDDGDSDDGPDAACSDPADVPEAALRRLTRSEYDNTLRDLGLVAAGESVAAGFGGDMILGGARRGFFVGGQVDEALARDLLDASVTVAAAATEDLAGLVGCAPTTVAEEDACARDFIAAFGRRAYRRALEDAEIDALAAVFSATRDAFDFRAGIEAVLSAMLNAPDFLYLVEHDPADAVAGDVVPLEGYALASRLSYFLWDSTPDEDLLAAAESGALATDEGLEAEVRRMLADPRAHGAVRQFLREWTFVEGLAAAPKDETRYPWFSAELAADLSESFLLSLEHAIWGPNPTLPEFVAGDTVFLNAAIAEAYGFADVEGDALQPVAVDADERLGMLTHPAFLALAAKPTRGDPIARGLFVREQLLCTELGEPPDTDENGDPIDFDVPPPEPGVSNRDRFHEHTASPLCSGCHQLLDPIGFGFESYDAVGLHRSIDEEGNQIDQSGEVIAGGDLDGSFDGAVELVERMVGSETVAECVTRQWFRFGLGRRETTADACSNALTLERFVASGSNMQELLVALATSAAFRHRKVGEP